MICAEFEASVGPYVDGELGPEATLEASSHLAQCPQCRGRLEQERRFRQLLRRQPRESAPPELRASIQASIRRRARRGAVRPWLAASAVAAAALLLAIALPAVRTPPSLVSDLVDKHIAYAQIEQPAEFASPNPGAVEAWLRDRGGLRTTVVDYSMSGIRLVGARIADAQEQRAAYVLYEKGHTLLSVFMVPTAGRAVALEGPSRSYRGHDYVTFERKGYRTVSWTEGRLVFGLVSMLDYEGLLECADKLRAERAQRVGA
jgi:mycothiol system anti-sigma-R factor